MVAATLPLRVSQYSQGELVKYAQIVINNQTMYSAMRMNFLERDRIYQRELDWTQEHLRARYGNLTGNALKIQNVTVPVVMPQVEAAHGFLVETFLSSYPIFPVVSGPEYIDVAKQIDAIMAESAVQFQYARHLGMAFRDGLKYNLMAVEVEWKNLKVYSVGNNAQKDVVFGVPVETSFSGNIIKRINPYNLIADPRVAPCEVHEKGDYVGYVELMTYIQLKNLFLELDNTLTMNHEAAFASNGAGITTQNGATGATISPYYVPEVNPAVLRDPNFIGQNWLTWVGLDTKRKIRSSGMYEITTLYVRIIPREMGINVGKEQGQNGVPQIFKLIIVNGQVCVYVERKSNAHNLLPIIIGQPIEDGLGYQTKSFADNAAPYQFLASSLYNSALASQRRKVYDRIVYDPSRINKSDIDRVDPVARIAVKTEAYGKPIGEAFEVMPYRDDGVPNILMMARDVTEMSDVSTGQNRVQRGQFQKGNKTLHEFDTVMDKSDARMRTTAVMIESSWFQPIKYVMKMNILQFQPPAQLFNQQTQKTVDIKPSELRQVAWQFQIADGVLPVSRLLNPEMLVQFLQFSQAAPALTVQYDIAGMVVYNMKLQGATWVDAFKRTPEQMAQTQAALQGPTNAEQRQPPAAAPAGTGAV